MGIYIWLCRCPCDSDMVNRTGWKNFGRRVFCSKIQFCQNLSVLQNLMEKLKTNHFVLITSKHLILICQNPVLIRLKCFVSNLFFYSFCSDFSIIKLLFYIMRILYLIFYYNILTLWKQIDSMVLKWFFSEFTFCRKFHMEQKFHFPTTSIVQ